MGMTIKKRGPGQPKMPDDQKRKPLMIRVNAAERAEILRRAEELGLPPATYVRDKALGLLDD